MPAGRGDAGDNSRMATDWPDEYGVGADCFDDDEHARWLERWTSPCPDGRPQRVATCLGYREREAGRVQLRVALRGSEGVCDAIVEEDEENVVVRLLVCCDENSFEEDEDHEYVNCPIHVYLQKPLGDRSVIDVETDRPVPLFVPNRL